MLIYTIHKVKIEMREGYVCDELTGVQSQGGTRHGVFPCLGELAHQTNKKLLIQRYNLPIHELKHTNLS